MLRPRNDHKKQRFGRTCLVRGHETEGRKAVIKKGPTTTRVASVDPDGVVNGTSHCVPSGDVYDVQPDVRNLKQRPQNNHSGRSFPTTVRVRGLDGDGRKFLVQAGNLQTRVIGIASSGLSFGDSFVVPCEFIYDEQDSGQPGTEHTTMSERGEVVVPAMLREARAVTGKWKVDIELTPEGWLLRPVGPADK